MDSSGDVRYVDDYGTVYSTSWRTTEVSGTNLLDFTTVISTPYVWGREITGRIVNKRVIRDGMCTIVRRVLAVTESGYEVVAEGDLSYECEVPLEFKKESTRSQFQHDLNYEITGAIESLVTIGPHFSDPDTDGDSCVFGEIDGGTDEVFQFINVWE